MEVTQCDRCGKVTRKYNPFQSSSFIEKKIDLCKKCLSDFDKFMKEKKK